jgi:hypothetical protein
MSDDGRVRQQEERLRDERREGRQGQPEDLAVVAPSRVAVLVSGAVSGS